VETVDTDVIPITHGRHMQLYDVNGDGFLDVVTDNDASIKIFYNQGLARTFNATPQIIPRAAGYNQGGEDFRVGDFNADGKPDLIYGTYYGDTVSDRVVLRLHNGAAGYTAANWGAAGTEILFPIPNQFPQSLDIADFDKDGNLDILSAGTDVTLFFGDGVNAASSEVDLLAAPAAGAECAKFGDVNGDTFPDVVVTYWTSGSVTLLTNDTAGGVTTQTFTLPGIQVDKCTMEDLDGDGFDDLIASSDATDDYYIMYADGAGGLDDGNIVTILPTTATISGRLPGIGDLNGDGCKDLSFTPAGGSVQTQISYNNGPAGGGTCLRGFVTP
jgi:hypothetical protein